MAGFIVRRILIAVPTLLAISVVLFTILTLAPGDPLGQLSQNPDVPPEVRAQLRQQLGIDQPVYVQYVKWLTSTARGNWGYSFASHVDVKVLIEQRLPATLLVVGSAYLVALAIAVPIGILSAVKQYSPLDNISTTFAYLGYSLPTFFTGLLFILIFSINLRWLPFIYTSDIQANGPEYLLELLRHAIMPIMVLALFQAAQLTRYVRASMLDVIHMDYVTTARAKGLSSVKVTLRHAFRNALIPVVTIIALEVPAIFTGAIVTEQIFRVPGIGSLLISSINSKDTPVVMAIVFTYAVLVVAFTLVADVLYGVLDPRVRPA
jgi:peptide/nickel transport system permease protein